MNTLNKKLDIHNYQIRYEAIKKEIPQRVGVKENVQTIIDFDSDMVHEGLSIPRRIKLVHTLCYFSKHYLKKEYKKATVEDLKKAIAKIESNEEYSVWTKHAYKVVMKKFYKWLEYGSDYRTHLNYPERVSWIRCNVKQKDQPKLNLSLVYGLHLL